MPPESFGDIGTKFQWDRPLLTAEVGNTDGKLSDVCLGVRVDSGISTSRRRLWNGAVVVDQHVYGLIGVTGVHLLDAVRAKARSCQTYVGEINKPVRVVKADAALPDLQGLDGSYAYCHSIPDLAERHWACEAFLVRGDLILAVSVGDGDGGEISALAHLAVVVPRMAEHLKEVA